MKKQKESFNDMKALNCLIFFLATIPFGPVVAQQPGIPGRPMGAQRPDEARALTKFNLDFPGGTPKQLAAAIEKAMGRPFNVFVPDEFADAQIPPFKVNNVDVSQLFAVLRKASPEFVSAGYGPGAAWQVTETSYAFRTEGTPSDDSIWYFYSKWPDWPPPAPKICRFYSLATYLDLGLTPDDITTAVQTGWKMLGEKETPTISYHKDTKLLIAVGESNKLETIDAVLNALDSSKSRQPAPVIRQQGILVPHPAQAAPVMPRAPRKPKTEN